jgi:capsid portal protein
LSSIKKLIRRFLGDTEKIKQLNDCLISVNKEGETLEEITKKIVSDFNSFGNCYAEIVKATDGGEEVVYLNHIQVYKVGVSKDKDKFAISDDWSDTSNDNNITIIPRYPEFTTGTVKRSIIQLKQYAAGLEYFGLPEWIAARLWAEIEYRIPKYNITKFKNGFTPSAFAQFFGAMNEDEAQELINGITATFTDTGNNSKIFAQVLRDESAKMNVEILEDKSEGKFLDLSKLASQALVTANRWTMSLTGFATAGKLGTNQQIRDEIEYVTNTTVKGIRRTILQRIVNVYVSELSKAKGEAFKGLQLDILSLTPVSIASLIDANQNLLINEKRKILGFDQLDEQGEQQLKQEQQNL